MPKIVIVVARLRYRRPSGYQGYHSNGPEGGATQRVAKERGMRPKVLRLIRLDGEPASALRLTSVEDGATSVEAPH